MPNSKMLHDTHEIDLQKLVEPSIRYHEPIKENTDIKNKLKEIEVKLDKLHSKLNLIFGDSVLIKGEWVSTKKGINYV